MVRKHFKCIRTYYIILNIDETFRCYYSPFIDIVFQLVESTLFITSGKQDFLQ